ncbi:Quinonprotein alcohol dehydrogenase-like-superfamily [Artemisia annua]|uniref:Quinonprotein alcohol dehydrogenase-like-superfamily n=1 Tax=Artemisia annua TaxID=35608 RepID=A0A2U1MP61_ARTAN|nr:Quinonprotein alcohol dehydrogenase-like-superfamily [Artemisia annua]
MEQNITALCDIDPMLDDIKILARCISIWKSHPKGKPNEVWSLDMILQDPKGNRVQATVRTKEHINNVGNYRFVFEQVVQNKKSHNKFIQQAQANTPFSLLTHLKEAKPKHYRDHGWSRLTPCGNETTNQPRKPNRDKHEVTKVTLVTRNGKKGEAHLVEWNVSERAIKKEYFGFRKRSMGVVQFDTTRNRFLATGDEFQIMFWDMDSTNLLSVTDAND